MSETDRDYPRGTVGVFPHFRASSFDCEDPEVTTIFDVVVDGELISRWTKRRWADRDLRRELRRR